MLTFTNNNNEQQSIPTFANNKQFNSILYHFPINSSAQNSSAKHSLSILTPILQYKHNTFQDIKNSNMNILFQLRNVIRLTYLT